MIENIYLEPSNTDYPSLCSRPQLAVEAMDELMKEIFAAVQSKGDEAVKTYSKIFDNSDIDISNATEEVFVNAGQTLSDELKSAIATAAANIRLFHKAQSTADITVETTQGVECSQKTVPIDSVGIYIPGGTAPLLSTVLMLAIPAQVAGCRRIVLCSPPSSEGGIHPAILYTAKLCGVTEVYSIGGAQAIAAMSLGTESIEKVDKVFGPGNQYVSAAKAYAARYGTAMDIPAGPSELLVYADATAKPSYVAADLLSQAEHGTDSQVVLVSPSAKIVNLVNEAIAKQLPALPRKDIAGKALKESRAIVISDVTAAWQYINTYAPEHLIIASTAPDQYVDKVTNAGSVFLGNYSPESIGDYASGTNHTLPTNGWARSYSGVNMDAFVKKITFQKVSKTGLQQLGPSVVTMALAETLQAHANAVTIRLQNIND